MLPIGKGVYARAQDVDFLASWDFVFVNGRRSDAESRARELMARGVEVWFYSTPERWTPQHWGEEIVFMRALVQRTHARGFVANAEANRETGAWFGLGIAARDVGRAFGRALGDIAAADRISVGFVSFPSFPRDILTGVVEGGAGRIWGSPEIYGRTSLDPRDFARWWAEWQALFGAGRVVLSVAGWQSNNAFSVAQAYNAYLAALPRAPGAIAWTTGVPPSHILNGLRAWNPAGNVFAQAMLVARSFLSTKMGLIVGALVVVGALALVGAWRLGYV